MSTRSNILIRDGYGEGLLFYRHSDGYPTGQETLLRFMNAVKEGKIRHNVSQSAGWLIVLGYAEYHGDKEISSFNDWKVGAYEPADLYGGDIEFFYICDLKTMEIIVYSANLWKCNLKNLRTQKNIDKAIEKGWLKEIGRITNFSDMGVLQTIEEADK